jgi:hypothetical protein
MKIKSSLRNDLTLALDACAGHVRDERVDGLRATKELLNEFARAARIQKKLLASLEAPLAASLQNEMQDIDGLDLLEWFERHLPIQWVEDRVLLPEALRPELIALAQEALQRVVGGELTPEQRASIARRMFARVLPDAPAQEKKFADAFIQLAWGSRHEPDVRAERAVEWMEEELRILWIASPRSERPYSPTAVYEIGDVVDHPRFGRGVVKARTDTAIEVAFPDRTRKLEASRRP